jgi:hypothetical protein
MSDSNRLEQESADAVEQMLLQAGRAAAPPGAKERSLAAVSSVVGVALVTSHAAASGTVAGAGGVAGAAKAGSLTMLHVIAVTGFTGVGAVAGAILIGHASGVARPTHESTTSPSAVLARSAGAVKPTRSASPQPPPPVVATGEALAVEPTTSVEAESKEPIRATASAPVAPGPSAGESPPPVRIEITMLDEARRALSLGEPARALSILDAYLTRFPHGTMAPEATLVRIEALVKAGDRPAAERAAEALGTSDPDNPYRSRVRSLLALPNH